MIISRGAIVLIVACVGISVGVVATSQKTLGLQRQLADVNRQIENEKKLIAVLESEWALLTSPPSVQMKVNKSGADLTPLTSSQIIASVEAIPFPLPELIIEETDATVMVSVEGIEGLIPLPTQKPGIRVRRPSAVQLAAIRQIGTADSPEPVVPDPTLEAPAELDPSNKDAIGDLLRDLSLAKDALAEVPTP